MHRWSKCPGSVKLSEGIESVSSEYAKEGIRAHEMAAQILETNGAFTLPLDEMREAVATYVEVIRSDSHRHTNLWIEQKLDLSSVYPGLRGTADAILYDGTQKLLRVYDFKYGSGIAVDVVDNEQLMYYGLGALLSTGVATVEVELVIVQPRCAHPDGRVRRWRFRSIEMLDFAAELRDLAEATTKPDAKLNPGDWCRFCPAAGFCPELHKNTLAVAQEQFLPTLSYDPQKLSKTLEWLPVLEGFIKSVREFAYNEAQHGRCPPGWKLVNKRATRKWRDPAQVEKLIGRHFMDDVARQCFTEPELKSPAQVEKVLGKDGKEFIATNVVAESSGQTLAPESDPRAPARLDAVTEFEAQSLFE